MKTENSVSRIAVINDGQSIMVSKSWVEGKPGYRYEITFDSFNLKEPVSIPVNSQSDLFAFGDKLKELASMILEE